MNGNQNETNTEVISFQGLLQDFLMIGNVLNNSFTYSFPFAKHMTYDKELGFYYLIITQETDRHLIKFKKKIIYLSIFDSSIFNTKFSQSLLAYTVICKYISISYS